MKKLIIIAMVLLTTLVSAQVSDTCHIVPSSVFRFGGGHIENGYAVLPNPQGFIILGTTMPSVAEGPNGDIDSVMGGMDVWLAQVSHTGQIIWQQTYGSTGAEFTALIEPALHGGYYVATTTKGRNLDAVENHGPPGPETTQDILLIKVDEVGNRIWAHCFGTPASEEARDMAITPSGSIVVTGYQFADSIPTETKTYTIEVNSSGELIHPAYSIDAPYIDVASAVVSMADSTFYVCGYGNYLPGTPYPGSGDIFIEKLDKSFHRLWLKFYGGNSIENISTLTYEKGELLISLATHSTTGPFQNADGFLKQQQMSVLVLDTAGIIKKSASFGGNYADMPSTVCYDPNTNGYILYGYSMSDDLPGFHGQGDAVVVWFDSTLTMIQYELFGGSQQESQDYYWTHHSLAKLGGDTVVFITRSNSFDGLCEGTVSRGDFDWIITVASASAWECPQDTISEPTGLIEQFYHPEMRGDDVLQVYNLMGSLVEVTKNKFFDPADVPAGIYILRQGARSKKFCKQ